MANNIRYRDLNCWPGGRGRSLAYILFHHILPGQKSHYDLMLELWPGHNSAARTLWGLQRAELPYSKANRMRWHTHGLHRRLNLNIECDIIGGVGMVKLVDKGRYMVQMRRRKLELHINGALLCGSYLLKRAGYGVHVWLSTPHKYDREGALNEC